MNGYEKMPPEVFMIITIGYSVTAFPFIPASITWGDFELKSVWPNPNKLSGPASWISLTKCIYKGISFTLMTMGDGIGWIPIFPGIVNGIDYGFDCMVGVSLRVTPMITSSEL